MKVQVSTLQRNDRVRTKDGAVHIITQKVNSASTMISTVRQEPGEVSWERDKIFADAWVEIAS